MPDRTRSIDDSHTAFGSPQTMTPERLGDSLARLVWESFSDFVSDGDAEVPLSELGVTHDDGVPDAHATEEGLIFLMWAHTRGTELAFARRVPPGRVREALDVMHSAVFEDMVTHGTPRAHLPLFEQRVSARYAEYHSAADVSDRALGRAVVRHLTRGSEPEGELVRSVSARAIAVADPLRDFLQEIELVES